MIKLRVIVNMMDVENVSESWKQCCTSWVPNGPAKFRRCFVGGNCTANRQLDESSSPGRVTNYPLSTIHSTAEDADRIEIIWRGRNWHCWLCSYTESSQIVGLCLLFFSFECYQLNQAMDPKPLTTAPVLQLRHPTSFCLKKPRLSVWLWREAPCIGTSRHHNQD